MTEIAFLLNGTPVRLPDPAPTRTLLDWLREDRGLTGTKEGCNEGDCGACTVMVTDADGPKALNACILFLPQIHGKAVRTVEGIASPGGSLHPVQQAMIEHHGSQCGFCTPGFITTMAVNHLTGENDHDTSLAGNLCRCTGYAPIHRAAQAAARAPAPGWINDTSSLLAFQKIPSGGEWPGTGQRGAESPPAFVPRSADELARWHEANPNGRLIAGATDVGLWVTKGLRDLGPVAFIAGVADLRGVSITDAGIRIGAATTIAEVLRAIEPFHRDLAAFLLRYGSPQVRNAATIGGNIANGSPIGDSPPPLIALGATLHLRLGAKRREIPLESFYISYGQQDRRPGEFVEAVTIPRQPDTLRVFKISKRFDQDISALCGAFDIRVTNGRINHARIAFGGMAGIPKRALSCETSLLGAEWSQASFALARPALERDFTPLSDMRASALYRMEAAKGLLMRVFLEAEGGAPRLSEIAP